MLSDISFVQRRELFIKGICHRFSLRTKETKFYFIFISSDTGDQEQRGCKRVRETELFLKGSFATYHLVPR